MNRTSLFGLALLMAASLHPARGLELLVPAYANPAGGDGPLMWSNIAAVGAAGEPGITFILNPASGPGVGPIDPNYINVGGTTGALLTATASGATAIGYIATGYAARDLSAVEADIDLYLSAAYWRGAGIQISGFFFDEVSNDLANVDYYESLKEYVGNHASGFSIMGNPGVGTTFDSSSGTSGFTITDYVNAFDTLVTFEQSGLNYRTNYTAPSWLGSVDASHFAHIVHSESSLSDMLADVALAVDRGAGYLYVTDDPLSPNPFDNVPTYWDAEVAAIAAVPEPATLGLLTFAAIAGLVMVLHRQRARR